MIKIKCIVVDDEPLAVSLLGSYIEKNPFLDLVLSTQNPIIALDFIQKNGADLVFLDIQMPELSGINFMKILGDKIKYILTTAYAEFAVEGYEHNVIDYLLKPISFSRFEKSVDKAKERLLKNETEENYFFVKSSGKLHRVFYDDILYIESIKDYVNIRTKNQEYIVLDTLKSLEEKLPDQQFCRLHKSYIVNINQIKSIATKSAFLHTDKEIPIGESYKTIFLNKLK